MEVDEKFKQEVKKNMENIRKKENPTTLEKMKLIRYYVNHEKYSESRILKLLKEWPEDEVMNIIDDVKKEDLKPKPKRYYVSLKEPLEDSVLK